jgi:hypothetical protein
MLDQLDTGLLSDCLPEVTRMARKFSHISTLLQYLRLSLTCMCEAWEEILMQMDLRLTKFVQVDNTSLTLRFLIFNELQCRWKANVYVDLLTEPYECVVASL